MITTNLSTLGITWGVRLADAPFSSRSVQRVKVSFSENQHDIAALELVGVPTEYIHQYVDKPIQLFVQISGGKQFQFFGYVSHVEARSVTHEGTVDGQPFQLYTMVCVGSSHLLRGVDTRAWENVSLETIVSEISKKYRFGYTIPKDAYVFKRLVQTEESLWKLIVKACNQLGYCVTLSNSHIHIWDIDKAFAHQPSYTVLRGTLNKQIVYSPSPGDIISIDSTIGASDVVTQVGNKTIAYLNNDGVLLDVDAFQVVNTQPTVITETSRFGSTLSVSVDSFEEAKRYVQSKTKQTNQHFAEVLIFGDPSIRPGGVVSINGYKGTFDGFWYVESVSHELLTDSLTTVLKLKKKGNYAVLPKFPLVKKYVPAPLPILINNTWVQQKEYTDVYN
jgi:hypothetical protein